MGWDRPLNFLIYNLMSDLEMSQCPALRSVCLEDGKLESLLLLHSMGFIPFRACLREVIYFEKLLQAILLKYISR